MNNFFKFFMLFALLLGMLFSQSCQKVVLDKQYFTIEGAELVKAKFPSATADIHIVNLDANGVVIPGGTNPVILSASENPDYVIVGIKDEYGYYQFTPQYDSNGNIYFVIVMTQELAEEGFTMLIALKKGDNAGETMEIPVTVHEVGTGKLQVSLSWDQPNDIDLHLVEPDGSEIYYGASNSDSGGELDLDSNPSCNIDGINNENITYNDDAVIQTGTYTVRVDMYSNCSVNENTHYVVTAYYNGELISTSTGSNPYNGSFSPTDEDAGGAGSGVTVMTFNINSAKKIKAYKFDIPHKGEKKALPKGAMLR